MLMPLVLLLGPQRTRHVQSGLVHPFNRAIAGRRGSVRQVSFWLLRGLQLHGVVSTPLDAWRPGTQSETAARGC